MGCMQSADFTAQPRPQPKTKKGGKKKKKVTQHSEVAEDATVGQEDANITKDQQPNPLTPPKPSNGSDHHSTSGSRSGRKPTITRPSASRAESAINQRGEPTDASQLGSKRAGMSRLMRINEGGLTATKLGSIRMWIDIGDHSELIDPQDVFSHERKMRRKLLKDCNNISSGGEGSSFQDQNGLSNMTTQYSNASRF